MRDAMSDEARERFTRIHRHYDLFNHLFSLGADIGWRNEAARESMVPKGSFRVLDAATGTGDLAIAISTEATRRGKRAEIIGMDFNEDMLSHAKAKARRLGMGNVRFEAGDALRLRYKPSTFDVVASGFALRNFDDLDVFAEEAKRVLKKGGRIVMLDMGRPDNPAFMNAYFKVIEAVGSLAGRKSYKWLTYSILNFDKRKAAGIFRKHGFRGVRVKSLSYDVAFLVTGKK